MAGTCFTCPLTLALLWGQDTGSLNFKKRGGHLNTGRINLTSNFSTHNLPDPPVLSEILDLPLKICRYIIKNLR